MSEQCQRAVDQTNRGIRVFMLCPRTGDINAENLRAFTGENIRDASRRTNIDGPETWTTTNGEQSRREARARARAQEREKEKEGMQVESICPSAKFTSPPLAPGSVYFFA